MNSADTAQTSPRSSLSFSLHSVYLSECLRKIDTPESVPISHKELHIQ